MSDFIDSDHPRGQAANAGQFRAKTNSAPTGELATPLPTITPADVHTADYTIDVLRNQILNEHVFDLQEGELDDVGNTILSWKTRSRYSPEHVFADRLRISPDGEIVAVEALASGDGRWYNQDPHGDELAAYRIKVNDVRLAHAGVFVHGQANDGGVYGRKFVGGRVEKSEHGSTFYDAAQVSKSIRQHIKRAIEWGALPSSYDYRVNTSKYAGGQSIRITVEGMPDAKQYTERQDGFAHGASGHVREITDALETIGNQWNTDQSSTMHDYFDNTYYLFVSIEDESMAKFRAEQRAIAARKRADKKAEAAA